MEISERSFPECFKALVDRICAAEGHTRGTLSKDMGIHIQSLSNAAYRGQVGFDLIRKIARRAKATPEEFFEIERAWLSMRTLKPSESPLRRSVKLNAALMEEITRFEGWLKKRGDLDTYLKWRKKRPILKQAADELRDDS